METLVMVILSLLGCMAIGVVTLGTPGPGGTPIAGKDGRCIVHGSPPIDLEITEWTAQGDSDLHSYGSSKSGGFKRTCHGNRQLTGTVQGKITVEQVLDSTIEDGDNVGLKLKVTGSGRMLTLNASIGNLTVSSNQDTSEPATFQFNYTSNGEYAWAASA